MSSKKIVSAKLLLQSIREGLSPEQLMEKHGLSPIGLGVVLKQIQEERDRRASQIIEDFLSGMGIRDIAARNGFSESRFLDILRIALSLKLERPLRSAVKEQPAEFPDSDSERRRYPRIRYPVLTSHVRDGAPQGSEFTILDISEKGVAVRGIPAGIDDEKTLMIGEANFDLPDPIRLTCTCRWADKDENTAGGQFAGFEITEISEADDRYLRSLIDAEQRLTASQQFVAT